jgi:hypothetical protein
MIRKSVSQRIVTILDYCYSGSARIGKGSKDAANSGRKAIDEKSQMLESGDGRYILAATQAGRINSSNKLLIRNSWNFSGLHSLLCDTGTDAD